MKHVCTDIVRETLFCCILIGADHVVLMSFDFVIGPTQRAVLASYTMVVPARLHNQCTGANSQSELVILNWL